MRRGDYAPFRLLLLSGGGRWVVDVCEHRCNGGTLSEDGS